MNFKIGQKVSVIYENLIGCDDGFKKRVKGKKGEVVYYRNEYIEVLLDGFMTYTPFYPCELMPERIYSTKLSKKLYPNLEEKNGWLYPKNS